MAQSEGPRQAGPEGGKARAVYLIPRERITAGIYGAALPGEQRLVEECAVSRVTVRRALAALAADGLVERSGVRIAASEQWVTAALAGPEVAAALGAEIGAALLSVTRIVRDAGGGAVEQLSALYRPDRFPLFMRTSRPGDEDSWRPEIGGVP